MNSYRTNLPVRTHLPYRVFQSLFQRGRILGKVLFELLGVALLIVIFRDSPQTYIYPMALFVYAARKPLADFLWRFPRAVAFLGLGTLLGLITEVFATFSNINLPPEDKVLLHPVPAYDLLFGLFYYFLFMLAWYVLLRKFAFSKTTVFIGSGMFGALVEQGGMHLVNVVANPFWGSLMLVIIMSAYAIFPTLTYLVTEDRFEGRRKPQWWQYGLIAAALFVFWAIYGNLVHPTLLEIFPKGF